MRTWIVAIRPRTHVDIRVRLCMRRKYAQSNSTNSSFGINFSQVAGQMNNFVALGQRIFLAVIAASFVIVVRL